MAHSDFVRQDGQWPNHFVPSPIDLQKFDRAQFESLNGDDGGAYNPETPIVLGGQCLQLIGAGPHILSGGVITQYGGRLALGHSDWPTFTVAQTRSLVAPIVGTRIDLADSAALDNSLDPVGTKFLFVTSGGTPLQWTIPQRYMHNGATLISAVVTFSVGAPHLAIPSSLPNFFISRLGLGHAAIASLGNVTLPAPASAAAYYNNGAPQSMTATMTANNVIDVSAYTYLLQLRDEWGTGGLGGNVYSSLTLNYGAITDMRSE